MFRALTAIAVVFAISVPLAAQDVDAVAGKRVVFLGDSITQSGEYVTLVTYYLEKLYPKKDFDLLGLGLASETLSGLSEDGHAGGKFPRPCLFERLGRILEKARPDVVFACYGINDGIYQPLDADRFAAFKKGVTRLTERCKAAGVKEVYLVTPPIFDFTPRGGEFNYDAVMTAYAKWETELKIPGVRVIDLHSAMRKARDSRTEAFSRDHVHPGDEGHLLMARTILTALAVKVPDAAVADIKKDPLYKLVAQKRATRSAQWMKHIGYTREKTVKPEALGTVEADAAKIQEKIDSLRRAQVEPWTLAWKKAAPSPFARVESPAAVVNNKLYLFGGFTDDLGASNQVDVYDPASDAWTRKKDMPTRLTHLNPAIDGNTIWFAGGFKGKHPGPVTDEVWKYDIAADTWTAGPPLPERRAGGGLAVVDGKLHYFGGYKADRDTNAGDHWSLAIDGGKAWQREADLPDPRGHVSAAVLDRKIYALGGDHGHDKTQIDVNSCHRFDPATKAWSEIASLPDGRSHFESSTIIHKGRILIVGGRCNSSKPPRNVVGDMLQYDPRANTWTVVGTMPEKLLAPAAAIISGNIVVTGGGLNNPRPLTATTRIAPLPPGK